MAKPTAEQAKRLLANTTPEKAFWVNNGPVLKNTIELAEAAKKLTPEQFTHHVNSQKNDFATWAQESLGDADLAKKLKKAKAIEGLAAAVTARLKELQKALK